MERLTNFWGNLKKCVDCSENSSCYSNQSCKHIVDSITKLREYEDLQEQGRLPELPCAVGDTVWFWHKETDPIEEAPFEGRVSGYEIVSSKTTYMIITPISRTFSWTPSDEKFDIEDFGITIFLTREEAEEALKMMEDKKCI